MKEKKQNPAVEQQIKNFFLSEYTPAKKEEWGNPGILVMSTHEIYHKLYMLYPGKGFKPEMVAEWLLEACFECIDMGEMKWEWILKTSQSPQ